MHKHKEECTPFKPFCDIDGFILAYGSELDTSDGQKMLRLSQTLKDASLLVASLMEQHDKDWKHPDPLMKERMALVVRELTYDKLSAEFADDSIPMGATQATLSANGFSEQFGFNASGASGYGGFYVKKHHRTLLGLNDHRVSSIHPSLKGLSYCAW